MMKPVINHPIPQDIDFREWMLSMPVVTLDLETYWDDQYSLSKMTMLEYVQDQRFKIQGIGIRIDYPHLDKYGEQKYYRDVNEAVAVLKSLDKWVMVGQNTKFDGYCLHYHHDVHATVYADTRSMSKGLWPFESASLKNLAIRLWPDNEIMRKGDELASSKGVRDWPESLHQTVGDIYCNQDVYLTAEAFWKMLPDYPTEELEIIHITTRMVCIPTVRTDHQLLQEAINDEKRERAIMLERTLEAINQAVKDKGLDYWNPDEKEAKKRKPLDKMVLSSRNRYIKLLREIFDLEIPMKEKTRPDGSTYMTEALAKNDPECIQLQEENPDLAWLFEARDMFASSQSMSRAQRMIDVSKPEKGYEIPIPLNYYEAHTGRYTGGEKINMQNLGRGSKHRLALLAPEGFVMHVADSSNVEARTNAGFAGQEELLEAFRNKRDVYSEFASKAFDMPVNKKDNPTERGAGKVCVGPDTLILTNNGIKPIIYLCPDDKIWDGIEWVSHQGVVCNGLKETVMAFGLEATPDHEILAGDSWVEWQQVLTSPSLMLKAIDRAHLPSPDGVIKSKTANPLAGTPSSPAIAAGRVWLIEQTFQADVLSGVMLALKLLRVENDMKNIGTSCQMTTTEQGFSTGYHPLSQDAITQKTKCTSITAYEGSLLAQNGDPTELHSLSIFKPLMDGTIQFSKWTEQTLTEAMSLVISGLSREKRTQETSEKSQTSNNASESLKRLSTVYDVVNAGPRNRFTVITELGPVIVHNCVLGLGYGMGAPTLKRTFASGPMGMEPTNFPLDMCQQMVHIYRSDNYMIAQSWRTASKYLEMMCCMQEGDQYEWGPLVVMKDKIRLPNGMHLNYPKLHFNTHYDSFVYWNGKFWKRIYGGALIENIIQALARIIVMHQCIKIDRLLQQHGGWIVMQVHDENIGIAKDLGEEKNDQLFKEINQLMCVPPTWMPELPLDSEGGWAFNYSK